MCVCESHLDHFSSLQLLDVGELSGITDHFAILHVDSALGIRGGDKVNQIQ